MNTSTTTTLESKLAGQDIGELCTDLNCNYAADELDATDPIENIVIQSVCTRARNVRGDMRLWFDAGAWCNRGMIRQGRS